MRLRVLSESLQKKLPFLNHAVSSKSQLPILLNIALSASGGFLTLQTTDLEIGIYIQIETIIEEEGEITVPAKIFSELIASLPQEEITFQTTGTKLEVLSKKTKSVFQTIPKEEFPALFKEKGKEVATIASKSMQEDFAKVVFSASLDTTRPALSGILIKKEQFGGEANGKAGFLLVATDGYRLSLKHHKPQQMQQWQETEEKTILIPSRVLKELLAMKEEGTTITLFISEENNQVLFSQGATVLVGRLIEGQYPPYQKIIPSDFETRVSFSREAMQKAVKVCSVFARDTANIMKLSLRKEEIIVSANSPQLGENTVSVEAKMSGEENDIAFNGRYLHDFFSNITEEQIIFEMTGPLNPGVFKIENDDSFLHLIMPIRVQG